MVRTQVVLVFGGAALGASAPTEGGEVRRGGHIVAAARLLFTCPCPSVVNKNTNSRSGPKGLPRGCTMPLCSRCVIHPLPPADPGCLQ